MKILYSFEKINHILKDFSTLTNYRVALFNDNFQELLAYPERLSPLCKLIRSDSILNEKCRLCDFNGFSRCKKLGKTMVYPCHVGLTEMIIPIFVNNQIHGYLMCGQIRSTKCSEELSIAPEYSQLLPISEIQNLYQHIPVSSEESIAAATNIIEILASYLSTSKYLSADNQSFSYKIDQYILDHITEPLDVSTLCEHFNYRKTAFYKITSSAFDMGIMKHIRYLRIQLAKEYLATTKKDISEIACLVGIDDYNYFTKVFKELEHCTPREYRKNNLTILLSETTSSPSSNHTLN